MPLAISKSGILVGVDGSPESDAAVSWATAEALVRGLPVTLMHVISPVITSWPVIPLEASVTEWQQQNAEKVLDDARKLVQAVAGDANPPGVDTEIRYGDISSTLAGASRDAFMTVVGSHGRGALGRAVLGSISSVLTHHGHGPIAIIRADEGVPRSRRAPVLLGVDGSSASEDATALAFDEASRRGVYLIALHAWSDARVLHIVGMDWAEYQEVGQEVLADRLARWQEKYPDVAVQRHVVCDEPARWLIGESPQAQLVVVGSHGRGGFAGMVLGSVSRKVAHAAKVPVVVVRPR
jgi:nucleotide-binding universal stress UspA family protein